VKVAADRAGIKNEDELTRRQELPGSPEPSTSAGIPFLGRASVLAGGQCGAMRCLRMALVVQLHPALAAEDREATRERRSIERRDNGVRAAVEVEQNTEGVSSIGLMSELERADDTDSVATRPVLPKARACLLGLPLHTPL